MADAKTTPATDAPSGIDPGAPFDPKAQPPAREPDHSQLKPVSVEQVHKALIEATKQANAFGGQLAKADLTMKPHEAGMIAPGIARYINSRPKLLLAVAAGGNEYLVSVCGAALYGWRIMQERAEQIEAEMANADADKTIANPTPPAADAATTKAGWA